MDGDIVGLSGWVGFVVGFGWRTVYGRERRWLGVCSFVSKLHVINCCSLGVFTGFNSPYYSVLVMRKPGLMERAKQYKYYVRSRGIL